MKKVYLLLFIVALLLPGNVLGSKSKDRLQSQDREVRGTGRKLSVLVITTPDAGHFFKLAALGRALVHKGHNVSLCTTEREGYDRKEIVNHAGMNFISAGRAQHSIEEYVKVHKLAVDHFRNGDTFKRYYANISQQILTHLNTLDKDWNMIIVVDIMFSAVSCFTSFYQWNIPIIIASSGIYALDVNHPSWPYPSILTEYTDNLTFLQRLHLKMIEMATSTLEPYVPSSQYSRLGLNCFPYYYRFGDTCEGTLAPLIVFNAMGFDYPRPLPPMIHFV